MKTEIKNELKRVASQLLTASEMTDNAKAFQQIKSAAAALSRLGVFGLQEQVKLTDEQREAIWKYFRQRSL